MIARGFSGSYSTAVEVPAIHLYEYGIIGICATMVIVVALNDTAVGGLVTL